MTAFKYLTKPPKIHSISEIRTPSVIQYVSTHNIPVFEVRKRGCEVITIDMVFRAGRPQESKKLTASCCAAMLREGAGPYSAQDFSEAVDFLGAAISTHTSLDFITIKAVCLKRHIEPIAEFLGTLLESPHFKKENWQHFKSKSKEKLKIQLAKNEIKSYRILTEEIFGPDHPYGYNSTPDLYDLLMITDLIAHYEQFLCAQNCQVFIAGDIENKDRKTIDNLCKHVKSGGRDGALVQVDTISRQPRTLNIPGNEAQTSIRIGRRSIARTHPEFDTLNFLCNILGGYFGSRLISKIREEKGLTYNIYCMLDSYIFSGDIIISTEVANENVGLCIEEIYKEMYLLTVELVGKKEIELVKNYMIGNYLNLFDGPFNSIRAIKSLALAQIPLDDLDSLIKTSLSADPYQIKDMARKYFNRNDFWNIIVGIPQL